MKTSATAIHTLKPKGWTEKLRGLRQEKKQRTVLIPILSDVIYREEQTPISEKACVTDLGFLNINVDSTITCNNCHIVEENKVSCYCVNCKVFLCDNCGKEHQLAKKVHKFLFRTGHLRGYEQTHVIDLSDERIIDIKCSNTNSIVMLKSKYGHKESVLATYELTGELRMEYIISTKDSKSRIACLNDSTVAITLPINRLIYISCTKPTIDKKEIQTTTEHTMTGGIACRADVLYVAFSDAVQVMNLAGQIKFKINLPSVNILHLVNNNKMLCVYSEENTEKAVSCLDLDNTENVFDFVNFPFYPNDITSDDVGNIIFSAEGLIWQADSDGKNSQVIISTPGYLHRYKTLCYDRESKTLVTCAFYNDQVHLYKKV